MSKSQRFAEFLRAAVEVKIKKILEVTKYQPHLLWFGDLPQGLDELRSPLLTTEWNAGDPRWLVVKRTPEPDRPSPPTSCVPWLEGVNLDSLDGLPALLADKVITDADGDEVVTEPPDEVREGWRRYVESKWTPWATRARIARVIRPVYQGLFAMHQELQGREESYEVLVGVGLYHDRRDQAQTIRRHLLAFPAEVLLDGKTGTITVSPSGEFEKARFEHDFLGAAALTAIKPVLNRLDPTVAELGPSLAAREAISEILKPVVHSLTPDATYLDEVSAVDAPPGGVRASFAAALILRPRGTRSLDDLLRGIAADSANGPAAERATLPWRRLMEDEQAWNVRTSTGGAGAPREVHRVYFPLPSNEEQSRIIRQTNGGPGVVVQGPPGTGKSHTIANLISHYLATGQRVLVTAQTGQALNVLREKLPPDLQALCVSLLGAGTASNKDLERSVRGILARQQQAEGPEQYQAQAASLERSLAEAEIELQRKERLLRDSRVAETETVEPVGGYRSTRAGIARILEHEAASLGWIEDEIAPDSAFPTLPWEPAEFARYHEGLTPSAKEKFTRAWCTLPFSAEQALDVLTEILSLRKLTGAFSPPRGVPAVPSELTIEGARQLLGWFKRLANAEQPGSEADASLLREVRTDALRGTVARWRLLRDEGVETLKPLTPVQLEAICPVTVGGSRTEAEAARDLQQLVEHYQNGGKRRVLGLFTPAVVKAADWVEREVRVDDVLVRSREEIERGVRALDGRRFLRKAMDVWEKWPLDPGASSRQQVGALQQRTASVSALLVLADEWVQLAEPARDWLCRVDAGVATRDLSATVSNYCVRLALGTALQQRDIYVEALKRDIAGRRPSDGTAAVVAALVQEDAEQLLLGLAAHKAESEQLQAFNEYRSFLTLVRAAAPRTAADIEVTEGTSGWATKFPLFERAWHHRQAATWLAIVLSNERIDAVERAARALRERIQTLIEELTAARAWFHALERIDDHRRASLERWSQAVRRIPQSGQSVFRRRAEARSFLGRCLDAIPAWVVSLPRLYDTVQAEPGMFDVAIVDEASQCWLDSLVVFYLAKQLVIVGDDKQISPTIVGVSDGEVERLAQAYLPDFEHRGMFTLDSSLFDHARVYLSASVPLREHFRCVPEIIRFSNELAYAENPLIPLRQCGRDRLVPLKAVFVEDGMRKGDLNDAEARRLVEVVGQCHSDEGYEESTFGVICLQGDAQAKLIERLLLERLGPSVFAERNLRCGDAYAFQGDERDIIFLSMVAAPNANNGTLTGFRFEQRFNVSLSRARDQMWLFHSVRESDVSPLCLRRRVLNFFYSPVDQRIHGVALDTPALQMRALRAVRDVERPPVPFDSWFEVDVALALAAGGYRLSAQVQVASRRIDLVVEGDGARLAVECDGDFWHGVEQFDLDTYRQRQLERAGWHFVRIRESLFRSNQRRAMQDVLDACDELGIQPWSGTEEEALPVGDVAVRFGSAKTGAATDSGSAASPEQFEAEDGDSEEISEPPLPVQQSGLLTDRREGPYSGYCGKGYPDPRTASLANVREAVLDIVGTDGPLPKASIYALYRNGCPTVQRAGKHLRTEINSAIAALQRAKKVVVFDEGVSRNPTEVIVRLPDQPRVAARPRGARPIDGIPLSELAMVFRTFAPSRPVIMAEGEELRRRVLERFELKNLTEKALSRLREAERLAFDEPFWIRLEGETALPFS